MSKTFRIILYVLLAFLLLFVFCLNTFTIVPFIFEALGIAIVEILLHQKQNRMKITNTQVCKYCKTEIDSQAIVCPNCKRGLSFNTNTTVLVILLLLVGLIIWGILSNNAPQKVRETVCGLGIRDDFPYCYYIDLN